MSDSLKTQLDAALAELKVRRDLEPGIRAIVADRNRLKLRVEALETENEALRTGSLGDAMALERMSHPVMAVAIRKRIGVETVTL